MNQETDDIAALLGDSATAFIAAHYESRKPRFDIETPLDVDRAIWREMAGLGWLGLALPESLGGLDMGMGAGAFLAEIMGRKAVPEPFVAAALMPSLLLSRCDAENPLVQRLANAIATGETLVTIAWQEAAGEFEPQAPAVRLQDGKISGDKCFVPAVESGTLMLVTARDGNDTVIVVVEAGQKGVEHQRQAGGSMAMARVIFDGAAIIDNAILLRGSAAVQALETAIEGARVATAAQLDGLCAGVLQKTVDYVGERVQFNRPIGSFQSIQHRCVDAKIGNLLGGASWRNAQRAFDADPLNPATLAAISAAKARCGDAAMQASKNGVQMHGGMGFTEECGVGIYLRAAMQLTNWLGSATHHRRRFLAITN